MNTKNSDKFQTSFSPWLFFVKFLKKGAKGFQKLFSDFNFKYPNTLQAIQLTFLYFFGFVDLVYSILSNVFSLGYFPEIFEPYFPIIRAILEFPLFRMWSSPEKVFFLSYVVIEFMVIRSIFKFSKLIRYNILLIFAVLMIQGLTMSFWDFLFNRQIAEPIIQWSFDQSDLFVSDKPIAIFFFLNTFIFFFLFYIYFYIQAIRGKFATIPNSSWLTDSIAFWLRVKTSSMKFGKGKKK